MTSKTPFNPKAYYQTYYLQVSNISCVCEDCWKAFATLQTLKRHQRTNQKCIIIKLKQQLQEKADKVEILSDGSTVYNMSSPSDIEFEQEPELKSYSVFNYLMWCFLIFLLLGPREFCTTLPFWTLYRFPRCPLCLLVSLVRFAYVCYHP